MHDHDEIADLQAIPVPALVLCPRDDLWDETHANISLFSNAPRGISGAANGFLELDTDQVADLIEGFLGA